MAVSLVLSSSSPSTTSDLSAEPGGVSRKLRRTLVLGPFRVVDVLLVGSLLNVTLEEVAPVDRRRIAIRGSAWALKFPSVLDDKVGGSCPLLLNDVKLPQLCLGDLRELLEARVVDVAGGPPAANLVDFSCCARTPQCVLHQGRGNPRAFEDPRVRFRVHVEVFREVDDEVVIFRRGSATLRNFVRIGARTNPLGPVLLRSVVEGTIVYEHVRLATVNVDLALGDGWEPGGYRLSSIPPARGTGEALQWAIYSTHRPRARSGYKFPVRVLQDVVWQFVYNRTLCNAEPDKDIAGLSVRTGT